MQDPFSGWGQDWDGGSVNQRVIVSSASSGNSIQQVVGSNFVFESGQRSNCNGITIAVSGAGNQAPYRRREMTSPWWSSESFSLTTTHRQTTGL